MKRLAVFTLTLLLIGGIAYAKDYEVKKKVGEYDVEVKIDKNPPVVHAETKKGESEIAAAQNIQKDESLRKGEKSSTLDPNIFFDNAKIKKAYQIAKEIPWVLDSIYCYCFCEESPVFKHKSLLSCYVDNHAAR